MLNFVLNYPRPEHDPEVVQNKVQQVVDGQQTTSRTSF